MKYRKVRRENLHFLLGACDEESCPFLKTLGQSPQGSLVDT